MSSGSIEVLNVVETRVSLYKMDIGVVIYHVGEGEEVFGVEEDLVSKRFQGVTCSLAFSVACIHSGGS